MNLPIVALVGPPNSGKSSLLNKISGKKGAVTSDVPGTTRDRQYVDVAWGDFSFTLVDTAGLIFKDDELEQNVKRQIDIAKEEADVLVFVADSTLDPVQLDRDVLVYFRKVKKPVILALNKVDAPSKGEERLGAYSKLGIKPAYAVSAVTGRGLGDLLDEITNQLEKLNLEKKPIEAEAGIKVSIVGKPNVGKSTLFNTILGKERSVVSNVPGTTRNSVDSHVIIDNTDFVFIDTAGLKKKQQAQELPDIYSGFQTFKSMRRSDVVIIVLNSLEEISKQDQQIAAEAYELKKGIILVANKMDAFDGDEKFLKDMLSSHFQFLWMCPVFLISGKEGTGVHEIISAIKDIYANRLKTADPEALKKLLAKKMKVNPPKLIRDQREPKVFGLNQLQTNPPEFELVVNFAAAISEQFRKAIANGIIRDLDFWGTPITLRINSKDRK